MRATIVTLLALWWPHPWHGSITTQLRDGLFIFACPCGESLGLPLDYVRSVGIIS